MVTADPAATTDTGPDELERILDRAASASATWGATSDRGRARALRRVADTLASARDELVPIAHEETGLPHGRLEGEVQRTAVQLRMFADLLKEGGHQRVVVDRADPDFSPAPRPDLRRMLVPFGPVLVFAASNFPFAFSVAGGDTASALAAGCPVVLKAHPGHPETSELTAHLVRSALREAGADAGVFDMISGVEPGVRALKDPRITAAAFTGSLAAGRHLFDIAASRPEPIPFYGELGSINPAVATAEAVRERPDDIARGFVGSFTLGAGQFCTKPGLLLVPEGTDLPERLRELVEGVDGQRLLTDKVADAYGQRLKELGSTSGVRFLAGGGQTVHGSGRPQAAASLFSVHARDFHEQAQTLLEESFGPASVVVEYGSVEEARRVLSLLTGSLTATMHTASSATEGEDRDVRLLLDAVRPKVGRIVFDEWPTGVAVTAAQQHGGPFPSTTSPAHTSVGTAAVDRFLRPVAYQNTPERFLPSALRDEPAGDRTPGG